MLRERTPVLLSRKDSLWGFIRHLGEAPIVSRGVGVSSTAHTHIHTGVTRQQHIATPIHAHSTGLFPGKHTFLRLDWREQRVWSKMGKLNPFCDALEAVSGQWISHTDLPAERNRENIHEEPHAHITPSKALPHSQDKGSPP